MSRLLMRVSRRKKWDDQFLLPSAQSQLVTRVEQSSTLKSTIPNHLLCSLKNNKTAGAKSSPHTRPFANYPLPAMETTDPDTPNLALTSTNTTGTDRVSSNKKNGQESKDRSRSCSKTSAAARSKETGNQKDDKKKQKRKSGDKADNKQNSGPYVPDTSLHADLYKDWPAVSIYIDSIVRSSWNFGPFEEGLYFPLQDADYGKLCCYLFPESLPGRLELAATVLVLSFLLDGQ
jgi:hypothetical protein